MFSKILITYLLGMIHVANAQESIVLPDSIIAPDTPTAVVPSQVTDPTPSLQVPKLEGTTLVLDRVVASVNGSGITQRQIDEKVEEYRQVLALSKERNRSGLPPLPVLQRRALDMLIDEELILQKMKSPYREASAEKLAAQMVDQMIQRLQEEMGKEKLIGQLSERNQTLDEFRSERVASQKRVIMVQQGIQSWIDEFLLVPTPQAEVEKYLEANPRLKDSSGQVDVQIILFRVPPDASEVVKDSIQRKAQRVLALARAGDQPFEDLVATYSEHEQSRAKGGVLEKITPQSPFPQFAVVLNLQPGQIYPELIRIDPGYCVVKLKSKNSLYNMVRKVMAEEEQKKALKAMRDEATIVMDRGLFPE